MHMRIDTHKREWLQWPFVHTHKHTHTHYSYASKVVRVRPARFITINIVLLEFIQRVLSCDPSDK